MWLSSVTGVGLKTTQLLSGNHFFLKFNPTQSFDLVLQKSLRPQTKILIKGRAQQKLYYFYYNL